MRRLFFVAYTCILVAGLWLLVTALVPQAASLSTTIWPVIIYNTWPVGVALSANTTLDTTIHPVVCVDGTTHSPIPCFATPAATATPAITATPTATPTPLSVPGWIGTNFGSGVDGPGPASGAIANGYYEYTSWTCSGAITTSNPNSIFIRSQGPVALDTGCTITPGLNSTNVGQLGGAGGSGGGGSSASVASSATIGSGFATLVNAPGASGISYSAAAALSAVAGNNGGAIPDWALDWAFSMGPAFRTQGGGLGSIGGNTGGTAGGSHGATIIVAPSITIASGVTFVNYGFAGVAPTAINKGGGGGGGGSDIWFVSRTFVDNGGVYRRSGGPGGAITQPSIQALNASCTTSVCGSGAFFTITGLTTGGLDASKITIDNGGTNYTSATCQVNAGTSGLVGSPACHFTFSGGAINGVVIDTPGSGGTLTTYSGAFIGGYGAAGRYKQFTLP